jgi:anti-sigma regulatory factor (Ser/Thr protein kinase)
VTAAVAVFLGAISLPGIPAAAGRARGYDTDHLGGCPQEVVDDTLLLTDELVTNAVRHSRSSRVGGKVAVTLAHSGHLVRVKVADEGADTEPQIVDDADVADESGRGLRLVEAFSSRWGVEHLDGTTVVWFEIDLPEREV